jgi:hypothetical protein
MDNTFELKVLILYQQYYIVNDQIQIFILK